MGTDRQLEDLVVIRPMRPEEGTGYLAYAPRCPGCMSDGETPHEALDNIIDALACADEAMKKRPTAR